MIGGKKCKMKNVKCKMKRRGYRGIFNFTFLILHSERRGFTLMEMLVALGLFAVVVTVATDLFLTFQRVSRKTESLEAMVANARLTVERIAAGVREGHIDYARYADLTSTSSERVLYLTNANQESLTFSYANCTSGSEAPDCIQLNGSESLTAANLGVRNAQFVIYPLQDPTHFVTGDGVDRRGQYAADAQPRVTILLSLDNRQSPEDRNYVRYDVQTTISSRAYVR